MGWHARTPAAADRTDIAIPLPWSGGFRRRRTTGWYTTPYPLYRRDLLTSTEGSEPEISLKNIALFSHYRSAFWSGSRWNLGLLSLPPYILASSKIGRRRRSAMSGI